MGRNYEQAVLWLWFDWCKLWPVQYARDSLAVKANGYHPVFDVIPSQAYKDFYYEVIRDHPTLKGLNAFEVIDITLNQIPAPEKPVVVTKPIVDTTVAAQANKLGRRASNVVPHKPLKGRKHTKR
jgi:hypothetical protein